MKAFCEGDEANEALAKAIVDEFIKQISGRIELITRHYTGETAEVYGDYCTYVVLVDDDNK